METVERDRWLRSFLADAEEEARRRGDRRVAPDHLALVFTRRAIVGDELLQQLGVDPLDWRDQITTVLGWREGALAERESRPAGRVADSATELRFAGTIEVDDGVRHIVELAKTEAAANDDTIGAAHFLIALLDEGDSVGAATGRWLGLTPGRVRAAAGLRNERRSIAGGAPSGLSSRRRATGPLVLCGGGTDTDLLLRVVGLAREQVGRSRPRAVLVDLGWQSRRPADQHAPHLEALRNAGADAVDSGLNDRSDGGSIDICRRLARADLVWFAGGNAAAIYDKLWATPALDAIGEAQDNGALVGGVSAGAMIWGEGTLSDLATLGDPEPFPLFGWLEQLVVFAHYAPSRERAFRARVQAFPGCQGLAIAHGGAVLVDPSFPHIRLIRRGVDGTDHVHLAGYQEALTVLQEG